MRGLERLDKLWGRYRPPVLPEELRELLRAHCYGGQARRQLLRPQEPQEPRIEYDGRFFYAACTRELGIGPARLDTESEFLGFLPAWYRVTVAVPKGWHHVGLLPFRGEDGRWGWPAEPGRELTGWVSGTELHLVRERLPRLGLEPWPAVIHERLLLHPGRPLDAFTAEKVREYAGGAAEARAELIDTIGKLASRPEQYHTRETHEPETLYTLENVERVYFDGSGWRARWEVPLNTWTAGHLHPEISAQVWARARARVALALLRVPPETILEVAGDAVIFSADPAWVDDGKIGTFRRKGKE